MQTRPMTVQHLIGSVRCALLLVVIAGCGTGASDSNTPAQSPFEVKNDNPPVEPTASNDVPDKPVNIEKPKPEKADSPPRPSSSTKSRNKLETALAELEVPPAWLASVTTRWDMNKPWKEGRIEIRRLLGKSDEASQREAIKLTWDDLQKDDIGNGHEYPIVSRRSGDPAKLGAPGAK